MALIIKKIESGDIFTRDFSPLVRNNEITFSTSEEIAVIYGPNGAGKSSLIKVLGDASNTKVEFSIDNTEYHAGAGVFHIINDQHNRNIISGNTRDFFLGDNIRHEFELQDQIAADRDAVISAILTLIKNVFGISAGSSPLIDLLPKAELAAFIKDCANAKSKGNRYTTDALVSLLSTLEHHTIPDYSPDKLTFVKNDWVSKQSIIKLLELLVGTEIRPNIHVHEIEENTEAIGILSRFHKSKCIVCDNDEIDWQALLAAKTAHRQATLDALEEKAREAIEKTIPFVPSSDPFGIKTCLLNAIAGGDAGAIAALYGELSVYKALYCELLENGIVDIVNESELIAHHSEYQCIVAERPEIADEDYLYIKEIISNSMSKPLTIERDSNRRLRIYLSNQEFLGKSRDELPLSTGEQNFLSLTFEFLKAKNSECPIVVIDDPVSSFDSIVSVI